MRQLKIQKSRAGESAAALILAVLCVWCLPRALGLDAQSMAIASHAVSLALAAGLYLLIRRAFSCRDRQLNGISYGLGALFSLITVVGEALQAEGELTAGWLKALDGLITAVPLAVAYGAVLVLALRRAESLMARPCPQGPEPVWKRVLGSGYLAFAVLLACWVPIWLAFWPGFFNADNVTQFYNYFDGMHNIRCCIR